MTALRRPDPVRIALQTAAEWSVALQGRHGDGLTPVRCPQHQCQGNACHCSPATWQGDMVVGLCIVNPAIDPAHVPAVVRKFI